MNTHTEITDHSESPASATCRVAIIGSQRQRVAKVTAIIRADESLGVVAASSLLSTQSTAAEDEVLAETTLPLPKCIPKSVEVEYLPCVATFDSYEDEHGATVRYLVKLEYHGPNGTLVKGKSLAPFFDNDAEDKNPFPGISAVAIGCGIDTEEDVDKIRVFLDTISSSCAAQLLSKQSGDDDGQDGCSGILVECIKPNSDYTSMKEENEAFRDLTDDEKKEAVRKGTMGPGKMANFVYRVAKDAIRQKWSKELTEYEQSLRAELPSELKSPDAESAPQLVELEETTPQPHIPNPDKTRYACKRCRTILFGVQDLEDPPHAQSQHNFRRTNTRYGGGDGSCQNHFIAQPLTWMNGCNDMEGKLHCPKCNTKVGHYSWTGAQCSCGTWVTPAIMVPVSKVDEMKPISHNVLAATGALFATPRTQPVVPIGVNSNLGMMNQRIGGMTISGGDALPHNVQR